MARTPTRAAPTRAVSRVTPTAPTKASNQLPPMPARGTPAAQLSPNQQRMAAAAANSLSARAAPTQAAGPDAQQFMQAARAAIAQTPARVVAQPQTQPLPPSPGRAPAQMPARGLGAVQQAANQQRMAAKTGAPLPSGMGMGGGQPAPPSRTSGNMPMPTMAGGMKKGGKVKKMAKGGSVSSASKRGDGCATKGKTKGRFV
jgi:hypothetical protein